MFYLAGVFIALFLAVILLNKQGKSRSDKILAAWLVFIGAHLMLYYLNFSGKVYEMPYLLGLDIPLPLVHPPFLYLYTASLCVPRLTSSWKPLLHFIPALLAYLYLIEFFLADPAYKVQVYQSKGGGYGAFMFVKTLANYASGIVYVALSARLLRQHTRNIHQFFSYEDKINLKWLQYLIGGTGAIWLAVLFGHEQVVFGAVVLFVLFIGNFGIRQVGIFTNLASFQPDLPMKDVQSESPDLPTFPTLPDSEGEPALPAESDKRKYQKSGLNSASADKLHKGLKELMETQKIYRDSELSLSDLAERLKTHPNYLSQVINEKEQKNFFDYVNNMRVAEFMELASNPKNRQFTLLALALDCGFNSKSSFIRYFKKTTGQVPSQYFQMQQSRQEWN